MASAERIHVQGPSSRRESRRKLQDVVHEFHDRQDSFFRGTYLELKPYGHIRYTNKFDDPNLPGEMQTTITLKKVSCGTEVTILQEAIPAAIPAEMCYLGWQESLNQLAKLVEPEIPDQL